MEGYKTLIVPRINHFGLASILRSRVKLVRVLIQFPIADTGDRLYPGISRKWPPDAADLVTPVHLLEVAYKAAKTMMLFRRPLPS